MELKQDKGPNALRRGRSLQPGVSYFLTLCVENRAPVLIPDTARVILTEAERMMIEEIWELRCLTVMPDHLHMVMTLGKGRTLDQAVARMKVKTKPLLRRTAATWQQNFYDHRIRLEDSVEATVRYIWMNPYRKNLLPIGEIWPWFYCCPRDWAWFEASTDLGHPFPEWLA